MSAREEDDALDDLYRGPREAFTQARNALAQRLVVQGDPGAAARVRAAKKPSVSAWAVNQLWWFHREAYEALHAAGAELLELQRSGASVAGQPANEARRAAVDALRSAAEVLLRDAGHACSAATLRKITQSLEASAAGGSFGPTAPLGRLHTELSPPGFGEVARFAPPHPTPNRAAARRAGAELERARAARELADAKATLRAAEQSAAEAEAALRRARQTLRDSEATLARARERHAVALAADEHARHRLEAVGDATNEEP